MKTTEVNGNGSCEKIVHGIEAAREALFAESRPALRTREHLLRLALNEAEAMAWQTSYPHLLFPALAAEKVQALAAWNTHQKSVRQLNAVSALAA